MSKQFSFNWRKPVPDELLTGGVFHRIAEDGTIIEPNCLVKVDEYGFFIYWTSDGREGQVIECSQISDVRLDSLKWMNGMSIAGQIDSDSKILCIYSGLDFVNITYTYFLAKSEQMDVWCKALSKVTHNFKANNVCPMMQLQKHWLKLCLMVNCNNKIPVRSISRTFASGKTEKMVMQALEELGLPGGKNDEIETHQFTFEKFIALYHKICPRTDIEELFSIISNRENHITASQLMEFLNDLQRDPRLNEILCPFYDRASVLYLISRYEENQDFVTKEWLSYDGFCRYLMSDENAPVFLDRLNIYQDMDQPLSHYYVNSSHNTYLSGRQFGGKSSVEMYRQVLISGCRCVELDCWDGPNNEPIITHGKAMCTDILFKDAVMAIKETAFITSDYPVILSFENHCSKHQQYILAKHCEDIFGDMLLKEPLPDVPLWPGVNLPSPNQLKGKILIKNKRLKAEVEKEQLERFLKGEKSQVETIDTSNNVEGEDSVTGDENANLMSVRETAHPENLNSSDLVDMLASESEFLQMKAKLDAEKETKLSLKMVGKSDSLNTDDEKELLANYHYQSATTNIHPYLSSLVNYIHPVKFQGFDSAEKRNHMYNMSSFNENAGLGLLKNHALEFVNYNKRQLSRIYPKGGRVDSSNYMPQIFWNAGCQMVSLNFQTPDLAMQLNQGKFEYNGNCGYLLKPDFMRRPDREFDPFSECPVDGVIAAHCSVQVISGQFLSDRKLGTYVEVDMFGLPTDTIRKEFRTKVVPNNGLNPLYNSDPFVFRKIVLPDLAILRIAVYEESGKLIGQRILPLDGLQAGYRHISLRTEGNFPLSLPTVFCKIALKTYIPDGYDPFVDALSDPKKWQSMAEHRAQQMKSMGIDESDIEEVPQLSASTKTSNGRETKAKLTSSNSLSGMFPIHSQASVKINQASRKEIESMFEPLDIEKLKQSRSYSKLCKHHAKELVTLKKRQQKDKLLTQKLHHTNSDADTKQHLLKKGNSASLLLCHRAESRPVTLANMPKSRSESEVPVPSLANGDVEQTLAWKTMLKRHFEEEIALRQSHIDKQYTVLHQNLTLTHEGQRKDLISKQEREMKELTSVQTKISLNTRKQLSNDKTIKTKAETERRMKEVTETSAKKFGDERQRLQIKHNRQLEYLRSAQTTETEKLNKSCEEEKQSIAKQFNTEMLEKIETVM